MAYTNAFCEQSYLSSFQLNILRRYFLHQGFGCLVVRDTLSQKRHLAVVTPDMQDAQAFAAGPVGTVRTERGIQDQHPE